METETLVWIIVAGVVVLSVLALVTALLKKRQRDRELRREQAGQLRFEAVAATPDVRTAAERLQHAEARAELAHVEARKADEEVVELTKVLAAEEAQREDHLREADRIDPDVKTGADGRHRS
ncbi:hypothetical protein [Nocardioides sp.]|uniref:hypothetical protein n=1 Tax=Nocardioides sp. TaxID=35761 RepID=UPI00286B76A0|nr:hypothetical protein [Nocardioides sp.]